MLGKHLQNATCNGLKNIPLNPLPHCFPALGKHKTCVQRQRAQQPTLVLAPELKLQSLDAPWHYAFDKKNSIPSSWADIEECSP